MIIDADPKLLEEVVPTDAPPAYDLATAGSSGTTVQPLALETKRRHSPEPTPGASSSVSPSSPGFTLARPGTKSSPQASPAVSSWLPSFFSLGASQADRDVKQTVIGLVRDLVHHGGESPDAIGILQSCAEACRARNLSLEHILQESSLEGHTPLYWAILKRSGSSGPQISLVDLLMSFPLAPPALADARAACLLTSDDTIFQRLRHSPGCAGLNTAEELLLGAQPADEVVVENAQGAVGAFKATIHLVHFQKRMRVSKKVSVEFIARGRIWSLSFQIAGAQDRHCVRPGAWIVTVAMGEDSPTTQVDSRLLILPNNPSSPTLAASAASPAASETSSSWASLTRGGSKKLSPIDLRLRSGETPLGERDRRDATRRHRAISVLSDVPSGAGLEFDGCPHLNLDGSLDATFEAEMTHRSVDAECTVM